MNVSGAVDVGDFDAPENPQASCNVFGHLSGFSPTLRRRAATR